MNEWPSRHSETGAHLDAEDLALLLEGNLAADKATDLRQHIAGCEDCYELFVMAAEAYETMEPPADHPDRPAAAPRWLQPLAFAAMAALAVTTGVLVYRQLDAPAGSRVEQATARLEVEDAELIEPPPPVYRSLRPDAPRKLAFGLGVESVHLALQVRAQDRDAAGQTLARLRGLWRQLEVEEIPNPFDGGPEAALERFEAVRQHNAERAYFDPTYFDLGVWTESGWLAAKSGRGEHFESAFHRDTPAAWLRQEPELAERVRPILGSEQPIPDPAAFEAIRDAYDPDR